MKLHFRPGYLEGQARLRAGERTPLTFKVAFDGDGDRLAVYLYDVRLYGFSATPARAGSGAHLRGGGASWALLPEVELRGASGFTSRVLPALVQLAAVGRGYKMPALDQARLAAAEVSGQGLRLRFASGGLPPPTPPDEELLLTLEGARAFADAEELLAQGKFAEAREAYLHAGRRRRGAPLRRRAAARAAGGGPAGARAGAGHRRLARRAAARSRPPALWAEAVVRERRGESARAAERFLALCELSRKNHEEAGAFFAAEAAARAARDVAPQMAVKALHELLGLRPDHLPSLKALARASDQAQDRAGAIRAYRRLAALARDPADAADAHVHLARLCALTEDDVAGARPALRGGAAAPPDHPDALYQLGELCHRSGEHLRAIKALDRLREVALGRHEVDRIGRANLLAGPVWETGLKQPENALLRFREAISLLPGEPEPLFFAARVAERLGKLQEALAGYQQAVELAGPRPRTEEIRKAAHACAPRAGPAAPQPSWATPPGRASTSRRALALDPADLVALEELIPYFRASGKAAELADACEKAAAVAEEPPRRAALWAEAGRALPRPAAAARQGRAAAHLRAGGRPEEPGARSRACWRWPRAGATAASSARCLKALARARRRARRSGCAAYRRLAVAARDLAFDLELAAHALRRGARARARRSAHAGRAVRAAAPARRHGRAGRGAGAARARLAEAQGDKRLAAAALRELAAGARGAAGPGGRGAGGAGEGRAARSRSPAVLLELANLSLRCERPQHARRALEDLLSSLPRHAAPERVAEVRARLGRACDLLGRPRRGHRSTTPLAFPLRRLDDELAERLEALYDETGAAAELTDLWAARAQALSQAEPRARRRAPLPAGRPRAARAPGPRRAPRRASPRRWRRARRPLRRRGAGRGSRRSRWTRGDSAGGRAAARAPRRPHPRVA